MKNAIFMKKFITALFMMMNNYSITKCLTTEVQLHKSRIGYDSYWDDYVMSWVNSYMLSENKRLEN